MKIAIPLAEGKLAQHFGHCASFAVINVEDNKIIGREDLIPPAHEPGVLPQWLHEQGAGMIIAGGMGSRAQDLFVSNGIQVVIGASADEPEKLVLAYLEGKLETGSNICDH